jgi:adenylyl-sulfate kinase
MAREGFVLWLEGLPGSGKTTLANLISARLRESGWPVEILDGDEVRRGLSPELGFSRKDRETHAHRVSYVSHLLSRQNVAVIVALITPYQTSRENARRVIGDRIFEVWVDCPVEVCQKRDPKGIYSGHQKGTVKNLTGVDDPFENPTHPDLVVDSNKLAPGNCVAKILDALMARGFLEGRLDIV